ncbi:hypothetical protein WMF28_01735 [Sorangium sp. So ce590]|uniref:hypothetical protein n=1 Tax=Sorangium sp. So ce590 TaxID=3133317 RepID=UPI003F601099
MNQGGNQQPSVEDMIQKGTRLWNDLRNALLSPDLDVDRAAAFSARYASTCKRGETLPINVASFAGTKENFFYIQTGPKGGEGAYANYIDPVHGVIVASYNYANKDTNTVETGSTERINNSEILYFQYHHACVKAREAGLSPLPMHKVKEIIRSSIANPATTAISSKFIKITQRFSDVTFLPGTDPFKALIATDNCKGVAFLLKDHPFELRCLTITSFVVWNGNYIRIKLKQDKGAYRAKKQAIEVRFEDQIAHGMELAEMYGWSPEAVLEMAMRGEFDEDVKRRKAIEERARLDPKSIPSYFV